MVKKKYSWSKRNTHDQKEILMHGQKDILMQGQEEILRDNKK
jgi:hypothetical protein